MPEPHLSEKESLWPSESDSKDNMCFKDDAKIWIRLKMFSSLWVKINLQCSITFSNNPHIEYNAWYVTNIQKDCWINECDQRFLMVASISLRRCQEICIIEADFINM